MIWGVIEDDDRALPPAWPLLLNLLVKILEEHLHDLAVGVGLGQREVDIAERIDCHDHRNPRGQLNRDDRVGGALDSPLHPPEVRHAQPSLIDAEKHLAFSGHLEHLDCKLLAEDQILR